MSLSHTPKDSMIYIQPIDFTLSTHEYHSLLDALRHSSRWNEIRLRTKPTGSPHREVDDIWVRFGKLDDPAVQQDKPFKCHWYYPELTAVIEPVTDRLMKQVDGTELGGVLVTRVPPGKQVYPHKDFGWHPSYFSKYHICVSADTDQAFCFEDQEYRCGSGDVFWFRNDVNHWVINNSVNARISLICCVRTPRGPLAP